MPASAHVGKFIAGAFVFLFDDQDRFLLLEENPDKKKYMFDLPGGTLEHGEHPQDCAAREAGEETGLQLEFTSPYCHLKLDHHESGQSILVAFFLARVVGSPEVNLSKEHRGYRWVTEEEYWAEDLTVSLSNEHVKEMLQLAKALR